MAYLPTPAQIDATTLARFLSDAKWDEPPARTWQAWQPGNDDTFYAEFEKRWIDEARMMAPEGTGTRLVLAQRGTTIDLPSGIVTVQPDPSGPAATARLDPHTARLLTQRVGWRPGLLHAGPGDLARTDIAWHDYRNDGPEVAPSWPDQCRACGIDQSYATLKDTLEQARWEQHPSHTFYPDQYDHLAMDRLVAHMDGDQDATQLAHQRIAAFEQDHPGPSGQPTLAQEFFASAQVRPLPDDAMTSMGSHTEVAFTMDGHPATLWLPGGDLSVESGHTAAVGRIAPYVAEYLDRVLQPLQGDPARIMTGPTAGLCANASQSGARTPTVASTQPTQTAPVAIPATVRHTQMGM